MSVPTSRQPNTIVNTFEITHGMLTAMRSLGVVLMIIGIVMFGSGLNMIVSATSANLLELGLALMSGIGGTVIFSGGAIVLAVSSRVRVVREYVDDSTGPIPVIDGH